MPASPPVKATYRWSLSCCLVSPSATSLRACFPLQTASILVAALARWAAMRVVAAESTRLATLQATELSPNVFWTTSLAAASMSETPEISFFIRATSMARDKSARSCSCTVVPSADSPEGRVRMSPAATEAARGSRALVLLVAADKR